MLTVLGARLIESSLTTLVFVLIIFLCRLESGDGFTWAWVVCAANKKQPNKYILIWFNRLPGISKSNLALIEEDGQNKDFAANLASILNTETLII